MLPKQRGREAQNIVVDHLAFGAELANSRPDVQRYSKQRQSLRRHNFNGLTGEEFLDWSTTIVVMVAFDFGQLASLRSLTEVFGPMCLILAILFFWVFIEPMVARSGKLFPWLITIGIVCLGIAFSSFGPNLEFTSKVSDFRALVFTPVLSSLLHDTYRTAVTRLTTIGVRV